ncbi:MAG: hypothetical protein R3281_08305 [Balneolaceae bacterium]|nr:hypothetical protein [Balneolaceae bacterium]
MSYTIFYWVHIVSYIAWLLALVGSLYFAWKAGKAYRSEGEKKFMQLERRSTSIGAHLGALGILISGGALASIPSGPQWGWFNFEMHSWLAVKQAIFFVILILVGFSIKRSVGFKKYLKSREESSLDQEARARWKKAYNTSLVVYALVVVNTLLGLFKPF